jgi:hypothetical protein
MRTAAASKHKIEYKSDSFAPSTHANSKHKQHKMNDGSKRPQQQQQVLAKNNHKQQHALPAATTSIGNEKNEEQQATASERQHPQPPRNAQ